MEREQFETEVNQMRPRLHREAIRYLHDNDNAEDITQEVVLKLWMLHDRLDEYRSIEALAMVITKRLCINLLHKQTIQLKEVHLSNREIPTDPETAMISQEEVNKIERLIYSLPDTQQAILRMKHTEGMEVAEIARLTGSSPEAVRQNLSRARRSILRHFVKE